MSYPSYPYKLLISTGEIVSLATVYRVLTQFRQAGLLMQHHFESGESVFELNNGTHHDHIVCLQCDYVEEFFDAAIEVRQEKAAVNHDFAIRDHALYIYADCTKKNCARGNR